MKLSNLQGAVAAAVLFLSAHCDAKGGHGLSHMKKHELRHVHHKATHPSPSAEGIEGGLQKRGTCAFPTNAGLVAVTPGLQNAGWAMSPDQPCKLDSYCPYACPSGQVMAQWSPKATSYTYPESMAGGLYCDHNGHVSKPFPEKPYCVDGTGSIGAQNKAGKSVAFCQTVLPGNEAMLIPTAVDSWAQLAVPGIDYWCETAAHFYVNPPGHDVTEACVWSDGTAPIGNWAPYVAGANTDANGMTFVKIGYNPVWTNSFLKNTAPSFGLEIECSGSGCNGTPCKIDPSQGVGVVSSADSASGAGGADFCVVTVPKGQTANIVVFTVGESDSGSGSGSSQPPAKSTVAPTTSAAPPPSPTPTMTPTSTQTPTPTPTTSSTSTSTSAPTSVPSSTHSSTTSTTSTTSSSESESSTSSSISSSSSVSSTSSSQTSSIYSASSSSSVYVGVAGNFFQNQTSTFAVPSATGTGSTTIQPTTTGAPAPSQTKASAASETLPSGSIFSLIVMIAVAGFIL